ncbi:hypothetical protein [Clostridium tyrobutyricum]|uniref:hypothetical protein n=1 Tax=Clostridium tyrobutyricum TaxID=1519 RepID=UPI0002FDAE7E|nr:hypothetical protein [Clostridium tyrobutyricum]
MGELSGFEDAIIKIYNCDPEEFEKFHIDKLGSIEWDSSTSLNFDTLIHQRFILELSNVFNQYIKSNCIPCEVDIAPFDVFLTNKEDIKQCQNIVQTDISVICDGDKLNDTGMYS